MDSNAKTTVSTMAELRALLREPSQVVKNKVLKTLDTHAGNIIAASSFVVIASSDAEGHCDATPRGDAPGFVRVLSPTQLLVPERNGNARADTLGNIIGNPRVGLLFFVPGWRETLRVNGYASITTDAALLKDSAVQGKTPKLGILLKVEEVFLHCGKASLRSGLWQPERWPAQTFASAGCMIADQTKLGEGTAFDAALEQEYREELY